MTLGLAVTVTTLEPYVDVCLMPQLSVGCLLLYILVLHSVPRDVAWRRRLPMRIVLMVSGPVQRPLGGDRC